VGFLNLLCGCDRLELDVFLHYPHCLFKCNHSVLIYGGVALGKDWLVCVRYAHVGLLVFETGGADL